MKKLQTLTLTTALLIISSLCFAQTYRLGQDNPDDKNEATSMEVPAFPGGDKAFKQFLAENLEYPADAKARKIEGNEVMQFVVAKDGEITNITVVEDLGGGCAEACIHLIKKLHKMVPGKKDGKNVKMETTLAIPFKLK